MSFREYARHRKVTLKVVQKAIASERIVTVTDAKGCQRINPEEADKAWFENTNPNMARNRGVDVPKLSKSRAIREDYEARLAKLEYEEKSGKLVDAEKVKRDAFDLARRVRDHILNIPDRISAELVGITDQPTMHNVLLRELNTALQELCDHKL